MLYLLNYIKGYLMERLKSFVTSELVLGGLVVLLSLMTAYSGYEGAMADSKQNEFEIKAQRELTDATAEYLTANQLIVYDYQLFDGAYTADNAEKAAYYEESYSPALAEAIIATPDDPFSPAYYDAVYKEANAMFDESDALYAVASQFDERGDALQLVLLVSALGLALVAWASLLKEGSMVRVSFAIIGIVAFVYTIMLYLGAPQAVAPV
ncbi:MAG: hypothetical protein RL076_396 [Chloroflexota bacterium]|jgi:hypothetical protein